MTKKNKNEKTQRQLEIDQLDEMLWRSTPLGKFLSTIKRKASKVSSSGAVTYKKEKRSWVVRINHWLSCILKLKSKLPST